MSAFHKRSELYCGLFNDRITVCFFSSFLYFVVRVGCRRKKFMFAISSADEFLVLSPIGGCQLGIRPYKLKSQ